LKLFKKNKINVLPKAKSRYQSKKAVTKAKAKLPKQSTLPKQSRYQSKAVTKAKPYKMSSSVQKNVVGKKKLSKTRLIFVEDEDVQQPTPVVITTHNSINTEHVSEKSIWMYMRRNKKTYPTYVWEDVEDISDDENDTPQAAGKRLSTMKTVRDQIRRREYAYKLVGFQNAGLFSTWSDPLPWSYEDTSTYPYSKNLEAYPYFQKTEKDF